MLLSTLLEVVRTGLGGITIVGSMFSLFRYKLKAIPYLFFFGIMFLSIVLFVPKVNEKFLEMMQEKLRLLILLVVEL